jgi:hypothetical protein
MRTVINVVGRQKRCSGDGTPDEGITCDGSCVDMRAQVG